MVMFFWGIAILQKIEAHSAMGLSLTLLGSIGPIITGVTFTYLTLNKQGQHDYWNRLTNHKHISTHWYLVILFFIPTLSFLSAYLSGFLHKAILTTPLSLIPAILSVLFMPFAEELGWHGYALDRIQEHYSALTASLILGTMWSLWHLPLFFMTGSFYKIFEIGTLDFWLYFINFIPLSIFFTWIYNNTNRSILATFLFYAMMNLTANCGIIPLAQPEFKYNVLIYSISAIIITIIWKPKNLTLT